MLRGSLALAPDDLDHHAMALNLDAAKFGRCLDDAATVAAVRREKAESVRLGTTGTPYFLIGVRKPGTAEVRFVRKIRGVNPYEVFKGALDSVLTARGQ
jgi:predicted DsbA family dithiol-disulfide isomerase